MSYRVRFTLPDGRTGHWAREYATREEARQAIRERQQETGLAYYVEEVVPTAAVPDATPDKTASQWPYWTASTPHPATPEARIRELEAELAQLRDAYDAAVQDRDVAKRSVARLEGNLAMVQASWAASVASCDAAWAITRHHQMRAACSDVSLERAIELGDAMHRAITAIHNDMPGTWWEGVTVALAEWKAYKESLAASRQGPAKASGGAGGSWHTGPGFQPGAGPGTASRFTVDLGAIEQEGPAKASEAPGEGQDSGEGEK